jgi:hypothetical protein
LRSVLVSDFDIGHFVAEFGEMSRRSFKNVIVGDPPPDVYPGTIVFGIDKYFGPNTFYGGITRSPSGDFTLSHLNGADIRKSEIGWHSSDGKRLDVNLASRSVSEYSTVDR